MAQATRTIGAVAAVNSAAKAARAYYAKQTLKDMMPEEVEMAKNNKEWLVTLGFSVPMSTPEWPRALGGPQRKSYRRMYKIFNVDARSGKVRSMKDKDLA